jgi:hypothetical protein
MFLPTFVSSLSMLSGGVDSSSFVWGYLDPGTGSLVFQMVIAGVLSGAYVLRSSLWSLRKYIARGLSRQ